MKILSWVNVSSKENSQAAKIFQQLDSDNNGYLTEADFVNGMAELPGGSLRMTSGAW
jgi:Ca2+-binding EF-hand superfamily protein